MERLPADRLAPATWRCGTAVHRGLEEAYRGLMQGNPRDDVMAGARRALERSWADERLPTIDGWLERSQTMLERTLRNDRLGVAAVLGVEVGFRDEYEGLPFAGYADLVLQRGPGVIEIVDHKITRFARTSAQLYDDRQLNLYGWFAQRRWPDTHTVFATQHYPPLDATVTVRLSDESMQAALTSLATTARNASADDAYEPRVGPECESCQWIERCPAWSERAVDNRVAVRGRV